MSSRTTPFETMAEVADYLSGDTIECLECGKHYRMLTGKHLRLVHGMTPDEYRARWGLPNTAPLAGQATRRARSEVAQQMIADGRLTYDHLPRAAAAAQAVPRDKSPIARRAQADLMRALRPGDHSKLPPGAKRADGRDADTARAAQQRRRQRPDRTPS